MYRSIEALLSFYRGAFFCRGENVRLTVKGGDPWSSIFESVVLEGA